VVNEPGVQVVLPFERPLFDARPAAQVDSMIDPDADADADVSALFMQPFVDQARLADNIRSAIPEHGSALLSDIVAAYPVEQGAAEIVGYLALAEDDLEVTADDQDETVIDYAAGQATHRMRMPTVTVTRR
jgi:hypothetical protein